jgi:hypothetical protein
MDYFYAVQEGKARVSKAVGLLQGVSGPSYPMLFLKLGVKEWTPVGEENLYSILEGKNGTAALVVCDGEGNSKAMSPWAARTEVEKQGAVLLSMGLSRFEGEVKLPI